MKKINTLSAAEIHAEAQKIRKASARNNEDFTVDEHDNLTFTEQGKTEFRSHFGKAGIDIRSIKTLDDFYRARQAAAPFFQDRLTAVAKEGEKTLERRLLIAVAAGDDTEADRLERLLDAKNKGIQSV
jgi:hypothetical protein